MSINENLSEILKRHYNLIYREDHLMWGRISLFLKNLCGEYRRGNVSLRKAPDGGSETECLGAISLQRASKFLPNKPCGCRCKISGKQESRRSPGYLLKPRLASFDDTPRKSLSERTCVEVVQSPYLSADMSGKQILPRCINFLWEITFGLLTKVFLIKFGYLLAN